MPDDEVWKPVPSRPGVMASSAGRVQLHGKTKPTFGYEARSSKTAKHVRLVLKSRAHGTLQVSRLVCEAFHGAAPAERPEARHLDGNSRNNSAANLAWATRREILNSDQFKAYCYQRIGADSPVVKGEIARQARRKALLQKIEAERTKEQP